LDKRAILKESITKLLQLGISDREIIDNLKGVGVDSETARTMLAETRKSMSGSPQVQIKAQQNSKPQEKQPEKLPEKQAMKVLEPQKEEEFTFPNDEDIYSKIDEPEPEKAEPASYVQKQPTKYAAHDPHSDEDVSELWEKGILATVDAKLNEMKLIRADLGTVLDQKISEKMRLETKKIETVLESQRSLFYTKIDSHLDSRANELKDVLESRAKQLEDLGAKVQNALSKIQGENKFNAELLNTLNDRLSGLDTVKSQMISETNTSLIGMESKFEDFMSASEGKRDEYEAKLNSALELQSKITEGLTEDLRQKIDSLRFEKEEELTRRMQAKISELDKLIAQVDSKGIGEKIARMKELDQQITSREKELDAQYSKTTDSLKKYIDSYLADVRKEFSAYKKEVAKVHADGLSELQKEYAANVDELFAENLIEWDKKLKEKKKEIDEIKSRVDVGKLEAAMESLDLFKEQFLNTVKKNIGDYNKTKKELAENMVSRDKSVADHLKRIDEKMKELSEFEKKFSSDVSGILSEVQGAKRAKLEKAAKRQRFEE